MLNQENAYRFVGHALMAAVASTTVHQNSAIATKVICRDGGLPVDSPNPHDSCDLLADCFDLMANQLRSNNDSQDYSKQSHMVHTLRQLLLSANDDFETIVDAPWHSKRESE